MSTDEHISELAADLGSLRSTLRTLADTGVISDRLEGSMRRVIDNADGHLAAIALETSTADMFAERTD